MSTWIQLGGSCNVISPLYRLYVSDVGSLFGTPPIIGSILDGAKKHNLSPDWPIIKIQEKTSEHSWAYCEIQHSNSEQYIKSRLIETHHKRTILYICQTKASICPIIDHARNVVRNLVVWYDRDGSTEPDKDVEWAICDKCDIVTSFSDTLKSIKGRVDPLKALNEAGLWEDVPNTNPLELDIWDEEVTYYGKNGALDELEKFRLAHLVPSYTEIDIKYKKLTL